VRRTSLLAPLIGVLVALPATAAAQHLSFAPEIGLYIPTQKLSQLAQGGDFSQLEAGPSFGARLGLLFGRRVGVEVSGAYIPTTYSLSTTSQVVKNDAKLFNGNSQVMFFLLPPTGLVSLYLSGGVGVMSRGGVAFTSAATKTNVTGVFGGGVGIHLGPIALTAGAEVNGYKAGYEGTSAAVAPVTQRDVHLKFGFGMPFGQREKKPPASRVALPGLNASARAPIGASSPVPPPRG
jgi:hypothetical protein